MFYVICVDGSLFDACIWPSWLIRALIHRSRPKRVISKTDKSINPRTLNEPWFSHVFSASSISSSSEHDQQFFLIDWANGGKIWTYIFRLFMFIKRIKVLSKCLIMQLHHAPISHCYYLKSIIPVWVSPCASLIRVHIKISSRWNTQKAKEMCHVHLLL